MVKIGVLSDTHSYLDDQILKHLRSCDVIFHAGDIGNMEVLEKIEALGKPTHAVYGNIDDDQVRKACPEHLTTTIDGVKFLMIHIAGKPGWYYPNVRDLIQKEKPKVFICGHSHIVRVQYFEKLKHLHINPGACGKHGFHKVRTLLTFHIEEGKPTEMKLIELEKRGQ